MRALRAVLACASLLALTACGSITREQAITGTANGLDCLGLVIHQTDQAYADANESGATRVVADAATATATVEATKACAEALAATKLKSGPPMPPTK